MIFFSESDNSIQTVVGSRSSRSLYRARAGLEKSPAELRKKKKHRWPCLAPALAFVSDFSVPNSSHCAYNTY